MEKAEAIVIRQVDFSESSRVVTFFSREYGKFAALAKGAKRLKGPFDAALDLLSICRVVFIKKSAGSLNLLTEARLVSRFRPESADLLRVYTGYYLAEILNGLTEDFDKAPALYDLALNTLSSLSSSESHPPSILVHFEVSLLREIGVLPNLFECSVCGEPADSDQNSTSTKYSHWVTQGGLLCAGCRREEYAGTSYSADAIRVLRQFSSSETVSDSPERLSPSTASECHRFAVSCITQMLGRKPATLRYLQF
jgi:DNA repair protein RecO (recombination protein O)